MRDDTGLSSSEVPLNIAGDDVDLVNTEENSESSSAASSKTLGLFWRRSIHRLINIVIVLIIANDVTGGHRDCDYWKRNN